MKRIIVASAIAALALGGLTACCDSDKERTPTPLEQGKECFAAGGQWDWNEWSGYHCEFGGDE